MPLQFPSGAVAHLPAATLPTAIAHKAPEATPVVESSPFLEFLKQQRLQLQQQQQQVRASARAPLFAPACALHKVDFGFRFR